MRSARPAAEDASGRLGTDLEDPEALGARGLAHGAARQLLADGKANKEIAEVLGISVKTAMSHREHVMQKLDLHSRTDLIRFALRRGVIRD